MRVGHYFSFDFETDEPVTVPAHVGRCEIDFLMFREGTPDHVSGWSHGRNGSTPVSWSLGLPQSPARAAVSDLMPEIAARVKAEALVRALQALVDVRPTSDATARKEAIKRAKFLLECEHGDAKGICDALVLAALDQMERGA